MTLSRCHSLRVKGSLSVVSALSLICALAASGASLTYDFNTAPAYILQPGIGTLWDGTSTSHCGSLFWAQTDGAGPWFMGGATNGPVYGVAQDGFLGLTFASWGCD